MRRESAVSTEETCTPLSPQGLAQHQVHSSQQETDSPPDSPTQQPRKKRKKVKSLSRV